MRKYSTFQLLTYDRAGEQYLASRRTPETMHLHVPVKATRHLLNHQPPTEIQSVRLMLRTSHMLLLILHQNRPSQTSSNAHIQPKLFPLRLLVLKVWNWAVLFSRNLPIVHTLSSTKYSWLLHLKTSQICEMYWENGKAKSGS